MKQEAEGYRATSEDELVPLKINHYHTRLIYSPSIHRWALWGALIGTIAIGALAWLYAEGILLINNIGQLASAGTGPLVFLGAGTGIAAGGLTGALIALYKLPRSRG